MPKLIFNRSAVALASAAGLCCIAALPAGAQVSQRAAFVANNGNLEGSVTSYTFAQDGTPQFVAKFITGGSGSPGTNAYGISLTPDGRYLATTHATASSTFEQVTLMRVNADATLSLVGVFQTPDSPLAAAWISNEHLAVTLTNLSQPNKVIVYRFDPQTPSLTEIDRKDTGGFTAYLAMHPSGEYLYAQDSPLGGGVYTLVGFRIEANGTLTNIGTTLTSPTYALGPGISADGTRIYGGGGISNGSNKIVGLFINALDGSLSPMGTSPYISPGSSPSPKQVVESLDGRFAFVGHGSSSEVRSFSIEPQTGALTDTGFAHDFGIQGDLGAAAVLGDWLLVTKKYSSPNTGLYSFTINQNGSFTMNGNLVSSQGSLPSYLVAWDPPASSCYANCDGSTTIPVLNVDDFVCFQQRFAAADPYANCDGSITVPVLNVNDFVCFQQRFAGGCP